MKVYYRKRRVVLKLTELENRVIRCIAKHDREELSTWLASCIHHTVGGFAEIKSGRQSMTGYLKRRTDRTVSYDDLLTYLRLHLPDSAALPDPAILDLYHPVEKPRRGEGEGRTRSK